MTNLKSQEEYANDSYLLSWSEALPEVNGVEQITFFIPYKSEEININPFIHYPELETLVPSLSPFCRMHRTAVLEKDTEGRWNYLEGKRQVYVPNLSDEFQSKFEIDLAESTEIRIFLLVLRYVSFKAKFKKGGEIGHKVAQKPRAQNNTRRSSFLEEIPAKTYKRRRLKIFAI